MSAGVLRPAYWLVCALPWPVQTTGWAAECAYAIAPSLVPHGNAGEEIEDVLNVAGLLERETEHRVIFFSDLTLRLSQAGQDWSSRGVVWERAIDDLQNAPTPGLYLTLSKRGHLILSGASREGMTLHFTDGTTEQLTHEERDTFRDMLRQQLEQDWAVYIQGLIDSGRIRVS